MAAAEAPPRAVADLSAFYFFTFGGLGALMPFLPLLLDARGLAPTEVGWIMLLSPVSTLVAPPLWGWLADTFQLRIALLRATGLGCAAGAGAFLLGDGLWGAAAAMAVYSLFRAPIIPLADSAAHAELGADDHRFAGIRIWGSAGFAIVAFTVGQLDGSAAPQTMLGLCAAAYVLSTVATLRIRGPRLARQPAVFADARGFLTRPVVLALLLGSLLYYVGHGAYDVYFGLHMKALGHDDAFVGLAWVVGVGAEMALMLVAPRLLRAVRPGPFILLGAIASTLRWGLLAHVETRPVILATQTLHALTFGLWYLALIRYLQTRAPARARTTVQSVAQAATGLGMMVGYVVGGELMESRGGAGVFTLAAAATAVSGLLYIPVAKRSAEREIASTSRAG